MKIKSKCWRVLEQRSKIYWAIKKREMKFNGSKREREREGGLMWNLLKILTNMKRCENKQNVVLLLKTFCIIIQAVTVMAIRK